MSSTRRLGFFGVDVSTSRPSNSNWGSGSFSTKFVESSSCNSTNLPATIQLTSFAGVWAREEIPPMLGEVVTAAVLVESVMAVISEANVVTRAGTTKSGLPWTVAAKQPVRPTKNQRQRLPSLRLGHRVGQWKTKTNTNQESPRARPPLARLKQN